MVFFRRGGAIQPAGRSFLNLSRSEFDLGTYRLQPITAATVETTDEQGNIVTWAASGDPPTYRPPLEFIGLTGRTYLLRIVTESGQLIGSQPETMPGVVPIDELRVDFQQEILF